MVSYFGHILESLSMLGHPGLFYQVLRHGFHSTTAGIHTVIYRTTASKSRVDRNVTYRTIPPPFFCISHATQQGRAYARDRDIAVWRPLPADDCHVDVRSLYFYWLFDGGGNDKVSLDTTYSYGF